MTTRATIATKDGSTRWARGAATARSGWAGPCCWPACTASRPTAWTLPCWAWTPRTPPGPCGSTSRSALPVRIPGSRWRKISKPIQAGQETDRPVFTSATGGDMTTQTRFQDRALAGDADIPGICDLINTCNAVDQLADEPYAAVEGTRQWLLQDPDRDPARDVRLWLDETGRIVGLAVLSIAPPDDEPEVNNHFFFRVHPETRNQGLETAIVNWAAARARAVAQERGKPGYLHSGLHLTTPEYVAYRRTALEALG